jgi:hypothetical protein
MSTLGLRIDQNMTRIDAIERKLVAMSLRLFPTYEPGFGLGIRACIELTALSDDGGDSAFPDGIYKLVQMDKYGGADHLGCDVYDLFAEIYANIDDRETASDQMFGNVEYITTEAATTVYRWLIMRMAEAEDEREEIPF